MPVAGRNDFEPVIFRLYPPLRRWKRSLLAAGAQTALLSGSGAALFGLFKTRREAEAACRALGEQAFVVSLVSGAEYRRMWRRWLRPHSEGREWPPRSRYRR